MSLLIHIMVILPMSSRPSPIVGSKIKLLLSNVRGFQSKRSQLEHILSIEPTIVVLKETFLKVDTNQQDIEIPKYECQLSSRVPNLKKSGGGGVALFYPEKL